MTELNQDLPLENDDDWRQELRRRAEAAILEQSVRVERLSPEELKSLTHELLVYQDELEMQNHELRL
ncbi:MAG: hybrid sensor histidine kinase/response regulator, partial [Anaerolineales bacterium]